MFALRSSWRWFVLPLVLGAFAPVACDDDGRIELVLPPGKIPDGGSWPDADLADAAVDGDAALDDAADAGVSRVLVGVTPNPRGDGTPGIGDLIEARLTAIAAGSRAVVVRRTPAELTTTTAWSQLESEASMYGKNGVAVNFVLAVVDGKTRGIESELSGLSWDDPVVLTAMHERIDQALMHLGATAHYFLVGRDVDLFLATHPIDRPAVTVFLLDLLAYIRTNPLAPPGLQIGVGFSFAGATTPDPSLPDVLAASDVVACSYLPGLGTGTAGLASNIAADMDILVASVMGKPIVVEALGYPSSDVVGGSDAKQGLFLETFFTVLGPRRSNFVFVNIEGLHDLAPGRCAARAMFEDQAADGVWAAYRCSLGLFTADSQAKTAWQVFVNGAAAFASP